jgi:hypothetical protein
LFCIAVAFVPAEKGIPGFWATVLARAELVQNEKDADALTYLTGAQNAAHKHSCSTCGSDVAAGWFVGVL